MAKPTRPVAPPPTKFGPHIVQGKRESPSRSGHAPPPTRFAPQSGATLPSASIARGFPNLLQPKTSHRAVPVTQPHFLPPRKNSGPWRAIQMSEAVEMSDSEELSDVEEESFSLVTIPNTSQVNELTGMFRNWKYPIGCSNGLLTSSAKDKKKYDVGAKIYDSSKKIIGSGVYENNTHAELNALDDALARGKTIDDISVIKVSKGCCRRCAVVMHILGIADKAGPKSAASCTGAYFIPGRICKLLAEKRKNKERPIEHILWVISNAEWW